MMTDPIQQFADMVRKKREELDMTQKDLADRTGTSVRTVSKIETGHGNPRFETIVIYAKVLHISLDAIISQDDAPNNEVPYCAVEYFSGMGAARAEQYIALCQQSDLLNGIGKKEQTR